MEDEKWNSDGGDVRLIDVSAEDDSLICFEIGNQNDGDYFQIHEGEVGPSKSDEDAEAEAERMRKSSGKCNLRKSLAWDSAFFTSAGVLEPEELSIINSGLNLPPIEEDIRNSADSSTSTIASDTFTLFDDVRASIHRSTKPTNKTPLISQSSTRINMDSASRTKPIIASKRQTSNTQGVQTTKKELHTINKEAQKTKRESAGNKKEASLRPHTQVSGRSGALNPSSLKPPKIVGRLNSSSTSPTRRATLGASRVKTDTNARKFTMGRKGSVGAPKRPVVGDFNFTPRSTPSPRSSSSSSVSGNKLESAASCSSHNRSGSTSSDSTDISPYSSSRKKTDCRNFNSASNIKPPRKIASINKAGVGKYHPSEHHLSISKCSSTISPPSSLDGWSSESSSSISANQHSNGPMKGIDVSSPCEELYSERGIFQTDMRKHHRNQLCVEQKRTVLSVPGSKVSISGTGSLTRPAATDIPRSSKPTGLRMPSPKFGYFDTEKSAEPTPTAFQFHPGVKSALTKHGAGVGNLHGSTVRAKAGKLQPSRSMTGKSSIHFDPCVSTTKTTARPQGFSDVFPKGTDPKAFQVICPSITSIPQDDDKLYGGSYLEVGDLGSSPYEEDTGNQNPSLNDMDTAREQVSATETTGDCSGISSNLQNDRCHRTYVVNYLNTEDVGESNNTEKDCMNICKNEGGDGGQDSVVLDIGLFGRKVYATKVAKELQRVPSEHNDLCKVTGSESPARNYKMRQGTEAENKELSLKGYNGCRGSSVNDIDILCGKLLHMSPIVGNNSKNQSSYRSSADDHSIRIVSIEAGKPLLHDLGHLESSLHHFHDINEKENSFCFENQADGLSKHMSSIDSYMEELTGKDDSFSVFEGQKYSPDTKLSAINSREVCVHDQDDFSNVMLKPISHSLSTNVMEIFPRTRTPLAVKPSPCNETAASEFASESMMEKVSANSITDGGQTNN